MIVFQELVLHIHIICFLHGVIISVLCLVININVVATLVSPYEVDHVDVCSVDISQNSLLWVDSDAHCFVDTYCLNSITWLHVVNEVLIHAEVNCVRGLTLRHSLWCLLQLYVLLIREVAAVVNHLEAIPSLAVFALIGLNNAPSLNEFVLQKATLEALEGCLLHLRNDVRVPNHYALYRYELVNVRRVEVSDAVMSSHVEWPDLNDGVILLLIAVVLRGILITSVCVREVRFLVEPSDYQIENGNDVGGVVLKLTVEYWVELE